MQKESDILNPDNPLVDSDEEDEDFEPEVPVENDGLFVTTRSGKGNRNTVITELKDVDSTLKRNASTVLAEMLRDDDEYEKSIEKKQKVFNNFLDLMTTKDNDINYFDQFIPVEETPQSQETQNADIWEAIKQLKNENAKDLSKHVVKYAGESIEISGSKESSQSLDTLVHTLEEKKTISTIDKSSYDWDKFKDKEGIKEEVEKAKKNGYIEKQEFLNRVDLRQFEKERQQRERERIQRDNEQRQRENRFLLVYSEFPPLLPNECPCMSYTLNYTGGKQMASDLVTFVNTEFGWRTNFLTNQTHRTLTTYFFLFMLKMALRYVDKVVIVTGGSKGIGAGIVQEFLKNGSKVVFCSRNIKEGKEFEEEMNKLGVGEAAFKECDVNKEEDMKNLVDFTVNRFGRIDCLVNNAGYHPLPNTIDAFSCQDLRDLFNLNVVSYFCLSKLCLPYLRKVQGNIINISSLVGNMGQKNACTYCTTKGAIHAMTRALAIDEGQYNVRVNSISPGGIWTPLFKEWVDVTSNPEMTMKCEEDQQHLRRLGTIEECGKLAVFLAADATYTTGTDNIISGGSELGYGNKYVRPQ